MRLTIWTAGLAALGPTNAFTLNLFSRQLTCDQYPLGEGLLFNLTELVRLTDAYLPRPTNTSADGDGPDQADEAFNATGASAPGLPVAPAPVFETEVVSNVSTLDALFPQARALFRRKAVRNRRMYPWCTVGKLFSWANETTGECSGAVVGRNLIMTASHCVPWDRGWRMQFVPAYDGESADPRPFGDAWVTRCRGVEVDEVSGVDYAVCRIDKNLGDRVGYSRQLTPWRWWCFFWPGPRSCWRTETSVSCRIRILQPLYPLFTAGSD